MKRKKLIRPEFTILFTLFFVSGFISCTPKEEKKQEKRPNVIVILLDDMGYSDLGCMGSEISTPNIDNLAKEGILYTNFYNTSRCSPSRASLLTGIYSHKTGIGHLDHDLKAPSYRGFISDKCLTIAEVLKEDGYRTILSGKWHVGTKRPHWPIDRGFERFFGFPAGGGIYFAPSTFIKRDLYLNDSLIQPREGFYSTDDFTSQAIDFIEEAKNDKTPFFLYLAYIAPHFPLQAHPEDIEKYKNTYAVGYDSIRNMRYRKQKELGIVSEKHILSPSEFPDWDAVEKKNVEAHKMAVYAAQMDCLDRNIGLLKKHLKESNLDDNTLIMFLSDNGGCAQEIDKSKDDDLIGTAESFVSYGKKWANVSNTPYRKFKRFEHEGGILTPLIVNWPEKIKNPRLERNYIGHLIDIVPTILEATGTEFPLTYNGKDIIPPDGKSFYNSFFNEAPNPDRFIYWEHEGNKGVRTGKWKLVATHKSEWSLYNLSSDPTELNDLIQKYPEKAKMLEDKYNQWAKENGVLPWPVKRKKKNN